MAQQRRRPNTMVYGNLAYDLDTLASQRQLEEELALQRTALQELRHRMKNNLHDARQPHPEPGL